MRRTIAFVVLLTATGLLAGCATADKSKTAGNANLAVTPANVNTGTANTNNANANMPANMNMGNKNIGNMNMSNMNMGKPNKKAIANKTP